MNNKGFTLIEVVAVVLLLALLALVVGPRVLEQKDKKEKEITDAEKQVLYVDAKAYVSENTEIYPVRPGNTFCISVNKLIEEGMVSMDASDFKNKIVKITVDENDNFMSSLVEKCTEVK